MQVIPIEPQRADAAYAPWLCEQLEQGHILLLQETPFLPSQADAEFLYAQRQSAGTRHKNLAYKPHRKTLSGLTGASEAEAERLKHILATYSEQALAFLSALLPAYAADWQVDYASFRPMEEQGRDLPIRHRNDLMHIDAFPTRPTHGGRILRAFTNLHSSRDRVWATAAPFEELAARYAFQAGLGRVTGVTARLQRSGARLARAVGVRVPDRSPYDLFMLRFHHYLKTNAAFQETGRRYQHQFPPGSTWISFTDQIAHAVVSGQYALEQTCIVSPSALRLPERAPLTVLERLAGRPLIARSSRATPADTPSHVHI